jgi:hypothetical protein
MIVLNLLIGVTMSSIDEIREEEENIEIVKEKVVIR